MDTRWGIASRSRVSAFAHRWIPEQYQVELLREYLTIDWNGFPWVPVVANQLLLRHGHAGAARQLLENSGYASFNGASIREFIDLDYIAPYWGDLFSVVASGVTMRGRRNLRRSLSIHAPARASIIFRICVAGIAAFTE